MHTSAEAAATGTATWTGAPSGIEPTAPVAKMKKIDPPGLRRKRTAMTAPIPETRAVTTMSTQMLVCAVPNRAPMPTQETSTPAAIDCRLIRERGDSNRA